MSNILAKQEQRHVVNLIREIVHQRPQIYSDGRYFRLKEQLVNAVNHHQIVRNVFGFHHLVLALETCLLGIHEMGFHEDSIIGCLLALTISDESQLNDIERQFGTDVKRIVLGMYKIDELYKRTPIIENENFRNLLISLAEDIRVVLILIIDRVNLMRCLRDVENKDARRDAAMEAAYLYAPLAHKLGLYKLKSELEDLSLKYLEHDVYYMIKEKLNATKAARDRYIEEFIAPISQMLTEAGLSFHIKGRTKSIHSIWQKMKKQRCPFEGVYDLFAIRIILDSAPEREKQECWQVYSLITDRYQPNPQRLRDWLSVPKSNGYESLHITVFGPQDKWVEVQIRTTRMDAIAEYGLAAHWRYKGIKSEKSGIENWLKGIRTALDASDNLQLMDQFKKELNDDEVYVFSPKGDLYKLAKGATVLDFAYHIHTNVGNHCVGALVNGKNTSMRQVLASGDQVEILTQNNQSPNVDWLNIAVTNRGKSKIRQALNEMDVKAGLFAKELLDRKLKNRKLEWDDTKINHLMKKYGYKDLKDFYKALSDERIDINNVLDQYQQLFDEEQNQQKHIQQHSASDFEIQQQDNVHSPQDDYVVIDQDMKGLDFTLAKCCNPICGDEIFGFVTINGGIKIHRRNCPNAHLLREKFGYRIVKARWNTNISHQYPINLRVVGNDDIGIINNITSLINKEKNTYLRSINIDSHDGLFTGILTIMIDDTIGLQSFMKKMRGIKGIKSIARE